jgi:uncharacterized membrane protein YhfC
MFVSAAVCVFAPAAAAVVMAVKRKGSFLMFVLGAVTFASSQLLLRIPLLGELQNAVWFNMLAVTQPLLCGLLMALSAGVFEETGRYAAARFLNKKLITWENGLMFGLGHGGLEAFVMAGVYYADTIAGTISGSDTVTALSVPPYYFLIGGAERILAVAMHIGFSLLVMYAVKRRHVLFFLLAILAHGLVDAMIPIFLPLSEWALEGVFAVYAVIAVIFTVKIRPAFDAERKTAKAFPGGTQATEG